MGSGCRIRWDSCFRPDRTAGTSTYATCVSMAARPHFGCSSEGTPHERILVLLWVSWRPEQVHGSPATVIQGSTGRAGNPSVAIQGGAASARRSEHGDRPYNCGGTHGVGNLVLVEETTPCWRGKVCIPNSSSIGYGRGRYRRSSYQGSTSRSP